MSGAKLGIFQDSAFWRKCRMRHLRHRLAVNTFVRWYRSDINVERRLPILSTYLGHTKVTDTYWYLEAIPELLRLALARVEHGGAR